MSSRSEEKDLSDYPDSFPRDLFCVKRWPLGGAGSWNQKRHMTLLIRRGLERCSCGDSRIFGALPSFSWAQDSLRPGVPSDEVLGVPFWNNSGRKTFVASRRWSSSNQADFQFCFRSRSRVGSDEGPKHHSQCLVTIRVLAQPEPRRPEMAIFEYLSMPKKGTSRISRLKWSPRDVCFSSDQRSHQGCDRLTFLKLPRVRQFHLWPRHWVPWDSWSPILGVLYQCGLQHKAHHDINWLWLLFHTPSPFLMYWPCKSFQLHLLIVTRQGGRPTEPAHRKGEVEVEPYSSGRWEEWVRRIDDRGQGRCVCRLGVGLCRTWEQPSLYSARVHVQEWAWPADKQWGTFNTRIKQAI